MDASDLPQNVCVILYFCQFLTTRKSNDATVTLWASARQILLLTSKFRSDFIYDGPGKRDIHEHDFKLFTKQSAFAESGLSIEGGSIEVLYIFRRGFLNLL